ncbi:MAG: hypothetical protein P4L43_14620 [Syntrophobacteraceae bacterium]|nr:hypothetical protein [Syntrophobacteraceae bacterium]
MAEMDCRFVAVKDIDFTDRSFEIGKFSSSTGVRESLERFGIFDPVWLLEKPGGYTVVDGFKRVGWAKENGGQDLLCRIFAQGSDPGRVFSQRMEKKIFEGEINPAEKAQIIAILARLFGLEEIPGLLLASLKASNRREVLCKWALVAQKGTPMLDALGSGEVCERAALDIADWDPGSSDSVLSLLRALRCSASIQVEIIERINEIAIREDITRSDVLEMERVRKIMSSQESNHREKTRALREYLSALRNPRLVSRRKEVRQEIEALGLPSGARIVFPEAFEGGGWQMELSFSGSEELRRIFRTIEPLVSSGQLDAVLGKR